MAGVRRVRVLVAVVAIWILGTWWYAWSPPVYTGYEPFSDGRLQEEEELPKVHWKKLPTRFPVETLASLPVPTSAVKIPRIQATKKNEDSAAQTRRLKRLQAVKDSFQHSWEGYKKNAWLHDEVRPLTGRSKDPFGGWAATLVDALDALWIMGMKEDFDVAVRACEQIDFTITPAKEINVFETTIRYLGGFLAAYELSGKQYATLLNKAVEVGELLICAFDTPNRMPVTRWNYRAYVDGDKQRASYSTLASELGSLSLEFTKLSQLTGDPTYYDAIQRVYDNLAWGQNRTYLPGMWPIVIDASTSKAPLRFDGDTFTLGGMSDSLYEYLPKQYLLLGGALDQPRKLYEIAIEVAKENLFRRALNPGNEPIVFSADVHISSRDSKFIFTTKPKAQHLGCFVGGMVGLGAKIFEHPADMDLAIQLTDGCVWAYNSTSSKVGPETFQFVPCEADLKSDDCKWTEERWSKAVERYWRPRDTIERPVPTKEMQAIIDGRRFPLGMLEVNDRRYILRPEAIESVFLMYRMTADSTWMEKAWDMFQTIDKHTRTTVAAAALDDVLDESPHHIDDMESFWLAETLKYFYLIFSDWDVVDLDRWVLNTEAHPLKRADAE